MHAPVPADDAAIELLLRDNKRGPPDPGDITPWDFACRWPETVLRTRVWPIVSRLLVDDDELIRSRCVELVRGWDKGADLTAPRLVEVAERHLDLYGAQKPEGITLRYELAFALENRTTAENGARVAAVLLQLAAHELVGAGVLARHEPMFIAERALAWKTWGFYEWLWIEHAMPSLALYRRDAVLPFLRALSGLEEATRVRILAKLEGYITRNDEHAALHARGVGVPPPTEPAPSPEECRRALGLSP